MTWELRINLFRYPRRVRALDAFTIAEGGGKVKRFLHFSKMKLAKNAQEGGDKGTGITERMPEWEGRKKQRQDSEARGGRAWESQNGRREEKEKWQGCCAGKGRGK